MISQNSIEAEMPSGAERLFCSRHVGWRNVLLRAYKDPLAVEDYRTTPTPDQKIVLVTAGACAIEAFRYGVWRGARYRAGHIGLVPPGEAARLRWRGREHHHTIQLHVSGGLMADVALDLFGRQGLGLGSLHALSLIDPVVATTMLALDHAARTGAPDLHAEATAHFIASHLLLRQSRIEARAQGNVDNVVLRRVDDYMQAGLARPVSLTELANVAALSRFQLLRLCKRSWGETPYRRLTRLRIEHAQRLLLSNRMTVIEVALECGYANPTHFATAFRRVCGQSPSQFLRGSRGNAGLNITVY